jgi:DNA polymerase (family 10)
VDKKEIAQILEEIGVLLELKGENPFKTRAYENAARVVSGLEGDLGEKIDSGELKKAKGIGEKIYDRIVTLYREGKLPYYEELRKSLPHGLVNMVRIPNLGAKKVKFLYEELGVETIDDLERAADEGRIAELEGFGEKSEENILKGIEFTRRHAGRYRLDRAEDVAANLRALLQDLPGVDRWEICGSYRRRRETVKDLDVVVSTKKPESIMRAFVEMSGVAEVVARGKTKSSVRLGDGMSVDLRAVSRAEFPAAVLYFTGSKEHNVALRGRAQRMGYKLNEYGLFKGNRRLKAGDEAAIFRKLDLDYIEPELRENTGEIEAAEEGELPELVELDDLKGILHVHSTYSDGKQSIAEMTDACRKRGYHYLGISDHSRTAAYAGGMKVNTVRKQHKEIDQLNEKLDGFVVFKGIESDILEDGSLDYPDEVLESFDFVVASVHSRFNLSRDRMTRRVIRAIEHPATTILGHPTGRLLLARDPYEIDLDAVLEAAAEHGVLVEINAHPQRLDLDWRHCKASRGLGLGICIGPDAHVTSGIDDVAYGIGVARRGWLTPKDVFNTKTAKQVARYFEARKSRD